MTHPTCNEHTLVQSALVVEYRLRCVAGESASAKAEGIALEQTVELAGDCVSDAIREEWVGEVLSLSELDEHLWRCRIAYNPALAGEELSQLLNTLFGNISLKSGIFIENIEWPTAMLTAFGGPGYGIEGLRRHLGVPEGLSLTCTALKPVGLSPSGLAELAFAFACGGVDIIKDDHGIANQPGAPFRERLVACQAAIERANQQTGKRAVYFPNATAPARLLGERLAAARDAGCFGVLLSPWLCGIDSIRWARDEFGLAVMAHPALTGSYFQADHGLDPALVLGDLFRIAGADASIYPNAGGRFGFSVETCEAINHRLRRPLGGLRAAAPTPGGGMNVRDAPAWIERYGADTIVLIGGSLYAQGDVTAASKRLLTALGR